MGNVIIQRKQSKKNNGLSSRKSSVAVGNEGARNYTGTPIFLQRKISERIRPVGIQRKTGEETRIAVSSAESMDQTSVLEEEEELVQAKLNIADDEYEQEADFVADTVMGLNDVDENHPHDTGIVQTPQIQRKCVNCEEDPKILRQPELNGSGLKEKTAKSPSSTRNLGSRIGSMRGGGQPLHHSARSFFEPRFGCSFENVRIHTNHSAGRLAKSLNAQAFTTGADIFFAAGRYTSGSDSSRALLAHELTHVVQQGKWGRPVLQRKPDPSAPSLQINSKTPVKAGNQEELLSMLNLPKDTVPPGALDDPQVLASLVARMQGASGSLLVPATGISEQLRDQLPDKQVVELGDLDLQSQLDLSADLRTAVRGASQGAGARLVRHGFNPNVKNAIGLVAYPQSRSVSAVSGTMRGKGPGGALRPAPVLPTTSIVLGHTAIYVKIDGEIKAIRSYATRSMLESVLHFKGIASGTYGAQAEIIDHLKPLPKGGKMFDVAGARSMEYPVSEQLAREFSKNLPEGGGLASKYTAAPDVAAKIGGLRLCNGVNCVHWAVDELEGFIKGKVATSAQPGLSLRDVGGRDAARQGKVMGFMTAADGAPVRMPGDSAATSPVFGRPTRGMRLLRWGGRVFFVYDLGAGIYNVWTAPPEEKLPVAMREGGRIGGSLVGAELGVAGCVAFGVATKGIGLLICGLFGAIGGAKAGEAVGAGMANLVMSPLIAIDVLISLLEGVVEFGEISGNLIRSFGDTIIQSIVAARASIDPYNWDVRYVPADIRADLLSIGYDIWDSLSGLNMDQFLGLAGQRLATYPISGKKLARLVERLNQSTGNSFTVEYFGKMKPHEFVSFWQERKLQFIVRPDYIAGIEWDDSELRRHSLFGHSLVTQRARINPENWDVSKLPEIEGDAYAPFMLGDELLMLAHIWWSRLGHLSEQEFREQANLPLSKYSIPRELLDQVAYGIQSAVRGYRAGTLLGESFTLPPGDFRAMAATMTPNDFVNFLTQWRVGPGYKRDPYSVGIEAMQWTSRGYQPW